MGQNFSVKENLSPAWLLHCFHHPSVSCHSSFQPYFWESLHAQTFNWSHAGKGWAPEDYQEPSWGVDNDKNSGDVSEPERNLVSWKWGSG